MLTVLPEDSLRLVQRRAQLPWTRAIARLCRIHQVLQRRAQCVAPLEETAVVAFTYFDHVFHSVTNEF